LFGDCFEPDPLPKETACLGAFLLEGLLPVGAGLGWVEVAWFSVDLGLGLGMFACCAVGSPFCLLELSVGDSM